jgi:phosphinothricin acetyltransferase
VNFGIEPLLRPSRQHESVSAAASIIMRDGCDADVPQLTEIYNHYVLTTHVTFDIEPFSVEQRRRDWFAHYRTDGPHRLVVAADRATVLGYATSSPFQTKPAYATSVATTIYCAPAAVGQGVGSLLYDKLFELLAGERLHRALAGIALPNDASLRLHRRFRFSEIGIEHEVGHKFGKFWDVLLLERSLP